MFKNKLAAAVAAYALLTFSGALNAVELKLLALWDHWAKKSLVWSMPRAGFTTYRHILTDIGPATLSDAALEEIAQIPLSELPLVQGRSANRRASHGYRQDRRHRIQLREPRGGNGGGAAHGASWFS